GDRFRLKNPAEVLYTVFPEDSGRGKYTTVLPHVVFTKATFPWSRYPTSAKPELPAAGIATEANVPTWLSVLLFDEDDLTPDGPLSLEPVMATIGDLFPQSLNEDSTLRDNYSYFFDASDTSGIDMGDTLSDPIQIVDIPLELFWRIAPTIEDL